MLTTTRAQAGHNTSVQNVQVKVMTTPIPHAMAMVLIHSNVRLQLRSRGDVRGRIDKSNSSRGLPTPAKSFGVLKLHSSSVRSSGNESLVLRSLCRFAFTKSNQATVRPTWAVPRAIMRQVFKRGQYTGVVPGDTESSVA